MSRTTSNCGCTTRWTSRCCRVELHGHRVDEERHVVGDDLDDRVAAGRPAVLGEGRGEDADVARCPAGRYVGELVLRGQRRRTGRPRCGRRGPRRRRGGSRRGAGRRPRRRADRPMPLRASASCDRLVEQLGLLRGRSSLTRPDSTTPSRGHRRRAGDADVEASRPGCAHEAREPLDSDLPRSRRCEEVLRDARRPGVPEGRLRTYQQVDDFAVDDRRSRRRAMTVDLDRRTAPTWIPSLRPQVRRRRDRPRAGGGRGRAPTEADIHVTIPGKPGEIDRHRPLEQSGADAVQTVDLDGQGLDPARRRQGRGPRRRPHAGGVRRREQGRRQVARRRVEGLTPSVTGVAAGFRLRRGLGRDRRPALRQLRCRGGQGGAAPLWSTSVGGPAPGACA